jgi:signal transduction histidine kinase
MSSNRDEGNGASARDPERAHEDSDTWKRFKKHALPVASVILAQSGILALFAFLLKSRNGRDPTIQRLTRKLIQASEEERSHIARELHDDIGQRLSLISIQLGALQRQQGADACSCEADLADSIRELDLLITDVHNLSHSLHSAKLEHVGLEAALGEVCARISQRHGLDVELRSSGVPSDLNPETALCFYRVAQEALSNVVKHSESSRAMVCVAGRIDGLAMQVIDFGIGFDPAAAAGLGLVTMEERLLALSGTFSIASKPGYGTTIAASAPVRQHLAVDKKKEVAGKC